MKIGIVGSGLVGASAAYAMVMKGVGREIVLVDKNTQRAEAETADLLHAVPFAHPLLVKKGEYADLKGCSLVVVSAGVSQKPGESRLDLLKRNAAVFRKVIPNILAYAAHTVLVIATNPLDIMTYLAAQFAAEYGLPETRVFGTGTMLDTARYRSLLGAHLGIDPQHVHGYVIGEHGDSEVLTWSLTTVGSTHVDTYCAQQRIPLEDRDRDRIEKEVKNAAERIIEGKGATYYGIGSAIAKIADVIIHDQRSILTVSATDSPGAHLSNAAISMPHLVGGQGIMASVPLPLNNEEERLLEKSVEVVRRAIAQLNADE